MVISCTNKVSIIGKWQLVGNGPVINFINDSAGSIEHTDNNALQKAENFKYHIQDDTLFEDTQPHFSKRRKWVISKLNKDSLIINWEGINACYYRLP